MPAAGPLMVSSELLSNPQRIPPAIAVNTPLMAGNPLAPAMPRQSGNAMRNTKSPDTKSNFMYFMNPTESPRGTSSSLGFIVDLESLIAYATFERILALVKTELVRM